MINDFPDDPPPTVAELLGNPYRPYWSLDDQEASGGLRDSLAAIVPRARWATRVRYTPRSIVGWYCCPACVFDGIMPCANHEQIAAHADEYEPELFAAHGLMPSDFPADRPSRYETNHVPAPEYALALGGAR